MIVKNLWDVFNVKVSCFSILCFTWLGFPSSGKAQLFPTLQEKINTDNRNCYPSLLGELCPECTVIVLLFYIFDRLGYLILKLFIFVSYIQQ